MNQKLVEYIKKNLEVGYTKEAIMQALLRAGYDINAAKSHIAYAINFEDKHDENINKRLIISAGILLVVMGVIIVPFVLFYFQFGNKEDSKEVNIVNSKDIERSNEDLNLLNLALIEHNPTICENITNNNTREQCNSIFMDKYINETCDKECQDKKILNQALIRNNISICLGIKNKEVKESCINIFGNKTEETTCDQACEDIKIMNLAIIEQDIGLCLEINDTFIKSQCRDLLDK